MLIKDFYKYNNVLIKLLHTSCALVSKATYAQMQKTPQIQYVKLKNRYYMISPLSSRPKKDVSF